MATNKTSLLKTLSEIFRRSQRWPKPFHVLQAIELIDHGMAVKEAARLAGTTQKKVVHFHNSSDLVTAFFGTNSADSGTMRRTQQILGQLLVGRCAELAFEDIYRQEMQEEELELKDLRESRNDTDYRLYNGKGRPVYRINIKFHGSRFRSAQEQVGLSPEDCFALATYKIYSALKKQDEDQLPYIFAIVGVSGLSAETIGQALPNGYVEIAALMHGSVKKLPRKRNFEDSVVKHLHKIKNPTFLDVLQQIENADWYILSARKADKLLKDKLFERVFALRLRNFAQKFRRAELDMHFSLSQDLTPLKEYLKVLKEDGYQRVTTMLERGDF